MQRPSFLIAIDPGAKGAIASYCTSYEGGGVPPSWRVERLSWTPQDRLEQLEGYATQADGLEAPRVAILETVGGFTGTAQPGSRMFTFGQGYGQLEGFLIALSYQIIRVRPQAWQGALSLKTRPGESKPDHKRRMRAKAQDLFPGRKISLDETDALLILYAHVMGNNIEKET